MPRKAEIQAEETAVIGSPLRRSTRKTTVNSPAPSTLTAKALQTQNEVAEVKGPKTRRASLSQESSEKNETVESNKPATRGRKASTSKEESEQKPEPVKTRSRRSSSTTEPIAEEDPKPQTVTRRRRSSAAEDTPKPEAVKPVRTRRGSATETPIEEDTPKKTIKTRRNSAKEEEPKEEPVKKATRSRRNSVDKPEDKEVEVKEKKTTTRGRRSSIDKLESEPESKTIKLTPVKTRRRPSVTENAVSLEPIEETESEIKSRISTSPILKQPIINITDIVTSNSAEVKTNLNLSVIDETSFIEEESKESKPEEEVTKLRRSPRLNKVTSPEKANSPKHSLETEATMEENNSLALDKESSSSTENVKDTEKKEESQRVTPKKIDFTNKEIVEPENDIKDGNEVDVESEITKCEESSTNNEEKPQIPEAEHYNISMGSDGSFKFHLNTSIANSQDDKEDNLNSSMTSNTSDKENVDINVPSSPAAAAKKSVAEEKEQVLNNLINIAADEKFLIEQKVVAVRVSDVFQPRGREYSFSEPMDVDEYSSVLEPEQDILDKTTVKNMLVISTPHTDKASTDFDEKPINKNLKRQSLVSLKDDSVDDSFNLCLSTGPDSQEEDEIDNSQSTVEERITVNSEENSNGTIVEVVTPEDHLKQETVKSPVKNVEEQEVISKETDVKLQATVNEDNLEETQCLQNQTKVNVPDIENTQSNLPELVVDMKSRSHSPEPVDNSNDQITNEMETNGTVEEEAVDLPKQGNVKEQKSVPTEMSPKVENEKVIENTADDDSIILKSSESNILAMESVLSKLEAKTNSNRSKSNSPQHMEEQSSDVKQELVPTSRNRNTRSPSFVTIDESSENRKSSRRKSKSPRSPPNNERFLENKTKSRQSDSPSQFTKVSPKKSRSPHPPEHDSQENSVEETIEEYVSPRLQENQAEKESSNLVLTVDKQLNVITPERNSDRLDEETKLEKSISSLTDVTVQNYQNIETHSTDDSPYEENLSKKDMDLVRSRRPELKTKLMNLQPENSEAKLNPPEEKPQTVIIQDVQFSLTNERCSIDESTTTTSELLLVKSIESKDEEEQKNTLKVDTCAEKITESRQVKKSLKSQQSDDYVFEVPSDEEESEKASTIEYDQNSFMNSFVSSLTTTTSNCTSDFSSITDVESAVLLSKKVVKEPEDSPMEDFSEENVEDVFKSCVDTNDGDIESDTINDTLKNESVDKNVADVFENVDTSNVVTGEEDITEIDNDFVNEVQSSEEEEDQETEKFSGKSKDNLNHQKIIKKLNVATVEDIEDSEKDITIEKKNKSKNRTLLTNFNSYVNFEETKKNDIEEEETKGNKEIKQLKKRKSNRKNVELDNINGDSDLESNTVKDVSPKKKSKLKILGKRKSCEISEDIVKPKKSRESIESITEESQNLKKKKTHLKKDAKKKEKKATKYLPYEINSDIEKENDDRKESAEKPTKKPKSKSFNSDEGLPKLSNFTKLDEYLSRKLSEMESDEESYSEEDTDPEEPNEFISTMAEEGEEDTPSEDSNAIIDEGESIHSTDTEYSTDEDYDDNDSFICDDEVEQLLSGEEYDLGNEKSRKKKKSRIIQLDNFNDDIFPIQKKEKVTPAIRKRSRIISVSDSSESNEENVQSYKDSSADENVENIKETNTSQDVIVVEDKTIDGVSESPGKRRLSSITIQENISVEEIRVSPLSNRITQIVNSFVSNVHTGEISMNLSLECSTRANEPTEEENKSKTGSVRHSTNDSASPTTSLNDTVNVTSEEATSEEEKRKSLRKRSVSMDHIELTMKGNKKRKLNKSMDNLNKVGTKNKKKINKKKRTEQKKTKKFTLSEDELRSHSFGLINQLITDVRNRPRRLIKPSTNMNNSWETEVVDIKPSTTAFDQQEKAAYKAGKVHPKDFRKQMLNDPSRVRRVETKKLLKKKGVYL